MFLEKLIERGYELKVFQDVLHRDHPDRHINWLKLPHPTQRGNGHFQFDSR